MADPKGSLAPIIVNLTPHPVVVRSAAGERVFESEGVARVTDVAQAPSEVAGLPVVEISQGAVTGLPEPEPGVVLLVSRVLAAARPDRTDLVFPFGEVRDENGVIVAVESLARFAPLPGVRDDLAAVEPPPVARVVVSDQPDGTAPATPALATPDAGGHISDGFWRIIDALSGLPTAVKVGLSMVLASCVGYLLEVAILETAELFVGGNKVLFIVGVLASLVASVIWGASQASGAHRGVFIHAVGDVRLARHLGEDAVLRAKSRQRWPNAPVLSFRPVVGGTSTGGNSPSSEADTAPDAPTVPGPVSVPDVVQPSVAAPPPWQEMAITLGESVAQQASRSRALAPASRMVTILPGGPPNVLVVAGATFQSLWQQDHRRLRFAADDTSDSGDPFIDFGLPPLPDHAAAPAPAPDSLDVPGVLLIISEVDTERVTTVKADIRHALHPPGLECVTHPGVIPEKSTEYRKIMANVVAALATLRDQGCQTVMLLGDAPAAIMFAAGYAAAHLNFVVTSVPWTFENPTPSPGTPSDPPALQPETASAAKGHYEFERVGGAHTDLSPLEDLDHTQQGSAASWWAAVITRALAIGVLLPVVGGSLALILEWGVAGSHPGELVTGDWAWLLSTLGFSLMLVWQVAARTRKPLDAPGFLITTEASAGDTARLGRRVVVVPASVQDDPVTLARHVTAVFCDAITALPELTDVTVDLSACPRGHDAINHPREGLRKSLRGNTPVVLKSDRGSCVSGPAKV